jgi:light-regulated signal transduction histidine kinase (bacteriophytochrome)
LIANALKYKRATPSIKVSCTEEAHAHHFCVADNGIGIDMQFADRIFVIFQRLHSKSEYEGVGIGLSLCKKVVENHGGRIWIQSQLGEGTEVHFTLPITTRGGSGA